MPTRGPGMAIEAIGAPALPTGNGSEDELIASHKKATKRVAAHISDVVVGLIVSCGRAPGSRWQTKVTELGGVRVGQERRSKGY